MRLRPRAAADLVEAPGTAAELEVHVRAAPVDGAANEALLRLLAEALDLPRSAVRLVAGARGRHKLLEADGVTRDEVLARLTARASGPGAGRPGADRPGHRGGSR
ncbi:MAG: DUF167 domain-containing protein [Candidatus Limnocylindrales bacterium]